MRDRILQTLSAIKSPGVNSGIFPPYNQNEKMLLGHDWNSRAARKELLGPSNGRWGSQFCSAALLGRERGVMGKRRKVLLASSPSAGVAVPYGVPLQPWGEKKEWKPRHSKTKANYTNSPKWNMRLVSWYGYVMIVYISLKSQSYHSIVVPALPLACAQAQYVHP